MLKKRLYYIFQNLKKIEENLQKWKKRPSYESKGCRFESCCEPTYKEWKQWNWKFYF